MESQYNSDYLISAYFRYINQGIIPFLVIIAVLILSIFIVIDVIQIIRGKKMKNGVDRLKLIARKGFYIFLIIMIHFELDVLVFSGYYFVMDGYSNLIFSILELLLIILSLIVVLRKRNNETLIRKCMLLLIMFIGLFMIKYLSHNMLIANYCSIDSSNKIYKLVSIYNFINLSASSLFVFIFSVCLNRNKKNIILSLIIFLIFVVLITTSYIFVKKHKNPLYISLSSPACDICNYNCMNDVVN